MSNGDVQFDLETESRESFTAKTPKMVSFVIKYSGGFIKDTTQANYVLLGFVAFIFAVSLILLLGGNGKQNQPSPQEMLRMLTSPTAGTPIK